MRLRNRIEGLDRLGAALSEVAAPQTLSADLGDAADAIRERAAANLTDGASPDSRSGALAQSLKVAPTSDGESYTVSTALDYGWHLEFGSRRRPASPWLAPAAESARPGLLARMRSRLNVTLAAALRRAP